MRHANCSSRLIVIMLSIAMLAMQLTLVYGTDYSTYQNHIIRNINGDRALDDVKTLASPEYQGRLAGDIGGYMAAQYIADQFAEYGIQPAGDDGTYYQTFTYPFYHVYPPVNLGMISPPTTWTYGTDYLVLQFTGSVSTTAEVVFAGYGLTMPAPFAYDDYAGIDVAGKIVLVFGHGPRDDVNWNIRVPGFPYPTWFFGYKVLNAFWHGAAGIIFVNDYRHDPEFYQATVHPYAYVPTFGSVFAHRTNVGESLMPNLQAIQNQIDDELTPASTSTGKIVNMVVTAVFDWERTTMNVLGIIPGSDPELKDEVVILSAHYDHLGIGPTNEIYYGADDDASGVACMLEVARVLASVDLSVRPKRTILFAAWTAEEEGLIGSWYYVDSPKYPLENTVAMVQMDMVGIGDAELWVFDGLELPDLYNIVKEAGDAVGVPTTAAEVSPYTDSYMFFISGVAAVFFQTTGEHPYLHTPADTFDTVSRELLLQTARVAGLTAWATANDVAIAPPKGLTTPYLKHKQTVTPSDLPSE